MIINFSAKFIKITFEKNEPFSDKSIRMKGEALSNGFDALLDSAEWLDNHIGSPVSSNDLWLIKELIEENNKTASFQVLFMGE